MNYPDFIEDPELESEQPTEEPRSKKILRVVYGVIGFLIIGGLLYTYGLRLLFFYQQTAPEIEQPPIKTGLDAEVISVPLTIFILKNDEAGGSKRSYENVENLVKNAANIWEQANIKLEIQRIIETEVDQNKLNIFYQNPQAFFRSIAGYNYPTLNVFLVENLKGINGIAFGDSRAVAIADKTSVYDFRVLAHEVGHVLGLSHPSHNKGQLMYQDAGGVTLSPEEIMRAREFAADF